MHNIIIMKKIDLYITEKLKLNKDVKEETLTWKEFCKKYNISKFTNFRYHCKGFGHDLIDKLDMLLKENIKNFIKDCKETYSIENLSLEYIKESDFSAEAYQIKVTLENKSYLVFTIFTRSSYEMSIQYFNLNDEQKQKINDILANILYKIINNEF